MSVFDECLTAAALRYEPSLNTANGKLVVTAIFRPIDAPRELLDGMCRAPVDRDQCMQRSTMEDASRAAAYGHRRAFAACHV